MVPVVKEVSQLSATSKTTRALSFWHHIVTRTLRDMSYDLSARQVAVLLQVYLDPTTHSVKSLSRTLGISKPAICRAIDTLERARLVRRQRDKDDGRNVFVQRTVKGAVYLTEFADIIIAVSREAL